MQGRIRAQVADVWGDAEGGWALPANPLGAGGMGVFAVPELGTGVWIEFERGDPDFPIWSGAWWGSPPDLSAAPYQQVIARTQGGQTLTLEDSPGGGITLETSSGQRIVLAEAGIEITNGKGASIKLSGPLVSVNDGALEVV